MVLFWSASISVSGSIIRLDAPMTSLLSDAAGVSLGHYGRIEPCSYPGLCRVGDRHWLWYSDREHFVPGRDLTALPADA